MVGTCVNYGFESPKLELILKFCEKISDLLLEFIEDFRKQNELPEDDEAIAEAFSGFTDTDKLMKKNPDGYRAVKGHYFMLQSVMDIILRDNEKRKSLMGYRNKFERLSYFFNNYNYLVRTFALCDEEKVIVIDAESENGWECSVQQIENNFSLMSLLQFSFHHNGVFKEMGVDYEYIEDTDLFAHNRFDFDNKNPQYDRDGAKIGFYTYRAYQPDGKMTILNGNKINPNNWIFGEMPVNSIPKIGEYIIIFISKKLEIGSRTWDIRFLLPVHPFVKPEFRVIKKLEKEEVTNWLDKISEVNLKTKTITNAV